MFTMTEPFTPLQIRLVVIGVVALLGMIGWLLGIVVEYVRDK